MADSPFRTAFDHSGLSVEDFAELIGVDPKTVQRWIAGTSTPYRRHRGAIARALDMPVQELWPDDEPDPEDPQTPARDHPAEEVVRSWGGNEPIDVSDIFTAATEIVEVLAPSTGLLTGPSVVPALGHAADRGCRVRILMPNAALSIDGFAALVRHPRVEGRFTGQPIGHAVYRADDSALLGIWLAGQEGQPFLLAERRRDHGLFDTITSHFQTLWAATPPAAEAAAEPNTSPRDQPTGRRVRQWPRG